MSLSGRRERFAGRPGAERILNIAEGEVCSRDLEVCTGLTTCEYIQVTGLVLESFPPGIPGLYKEKGTGKPV